MGVKSEKGTQADTSEIISFSDFLTGKPPGAKVTIAAPDVGAVFPRGSQLAVKVPCPVIRLNCANCGGERNFAPAYSDRYFEFVVEAPGGRAARRNFLQFHCRDCTESAYIFALYLWIDISSTGETRLRALKIGQEPPFGGRLPDNLLALAGKSRELMLQGWKAEKAALGIGAFAYYRRVVEHARKSLISRIRSVLEQQGAIPQETEKALVSAEGAENFGDAAKALARISPDSLMMHGENPMSLLFKAVSNHLHEEDDATCLQRAQMIRTVLAEFARRVEELTRSDSGLKAAIVGLKKLTE